MLLSVLALRQAIKLIILLYTSLVLMLPYIKENDQNKGNTKLLMIIPLLQLSYALANVIIKILYIAFMFLLFTDLRKQSYLSAIISPTSLAIISILSFTLVNSFLYFIKLTLCLFFLPFLQYLSLQTFKSIFC